MNVSFKKIDAQLSKTIKKFQEGGPAPEAGAPEDQMNQPAPEEGAPEGGEDPLMQLVQMAVQALQSQDCQMAMQVCQAFVQLIQQAQGGAPEQPQGQPVFGKGGRLLRRVRN